MSRLSGLVQRGDCSALALMPKNLVEFFNDNPWLLEEEKLPGIDSLKQKTALKKPVGKRTIRLDQSPIPAHWIADETEFPKVSVQYQSPMFCCEFDGVTVLTTDPELVKLAGENAHQLEFE